jgi:predicted transcriptional regulator of viral defense system
MKTSDKEALYMTLDEVAELLGVSKARVHKMNADNLIERMKGGVYNRANVEAYKAKRGDKRGGRYPKMDEEDSL